jgi:RNA polymerase sigma-70 factor (ECF subfamily)
MQSRDKLLFEQLVRPHFDALYRAAFRLARNREDAEDLVQESCLRAFSHLVDLERSVSPRAWLLRIQYRLFVDAHRRRRRSPVANADGRGDPAASTPSDQPGVDAIADGIASRADLESAWQRLDKAQRALLALHAEGYSLTELEVITGATKNALSARLHRARSRLAKLLRASAVVELPMNRLES